MARIINWDSEDKVKSELSKRLTYAREHRRHVEYTWEENERTVYAKSGSATSPRTNYSFDNDFQLGQEAVDQSKHDMNVTYAFKNFRFIHAQMSANPPTVVARPASSDQDDRRKADAADRLIRHAIRTYKMQERVDMATLNTLLYGTGFLKTYWDTERGDVLSFDEESGEVTLEGDIHIYAPHTWNIYVDPDADTWEEVRYVLEKKTISYEDAISRFPKESREKLKQARITARSHVPTVGAHSITETEKYDAVVVYEYWEKGLPANGYLGRHVICLEDGTPLTEVGPNPYRFAKAGKASEIAASDEYTDEQKEKLLRRLPKIAELPYHCLTDVDVPEMVWGRSFIEYVAGLQDLLNRTDSAMLDSLQAHGVARMILPEGAEIQDDSITNSPWDVIKMTGTQPPHFMEPMPLPPAMTELRQNIRLGIDDMSGVNEAMFGQQSREGSGFQMQYATNQGNMIRRRLFNKYVLFVESIYKGYLKLVRRHWDLPRTISVIGKEKALEAVDVKGADIDGGFDLQVEYGASLSLDPMTRREEILTLQPLFEKAGVPARVSLQMMKLNELEGMYDMLQLAEDRQREIHEEMIATGRYIPPEEFQDHDNMLAYAKQYFMTTEFKYLEPEMKDLLKQHFRDRLALAAQEKAPVAEVGPLGVPGPPPQGPAGPLPQPAEMTGEQADTEEIPPLVTE